MIPVILSGGSGTRLWPLSRPHYPKQFLPLHSHLTLFQETLKRLEKIGIGNPLIVSNDEHRFIVAENMRGIGMQAARIILEPVGRNTAPAIAIAAFAALEIEPDPILFVLPADHVIEDQKAFEDATRRAKELAQEGHLVTFGITPSSPHTGYGYIEAGVEAGDRAFEIKSFREKPDLGTAENFLAQGGFFWNSGMFVFKASHYLTALEEFEPDLLLKARTAYTQSKQDLDFLRLDSAAFEECKNISIDYAVMERTHDGVVVTLDAGWCDVGSWNSLWEVLPKDAGGNVIRGDVTLKDTTDTYIYAEHKLVTALGVKDLIIIDTKDALLIADRHNVEGLKDIVGPLTDAGRKEALHHRTIYRPWGYYDAISAGERDEVKRITVRPGKKISLQKHERRAEHWVVVRGLAKIVRGDETLTVKENESVYLPFGMPHSLENIGPEDLEVIEIQTGGSFGDEDIIRIA
jgi:mannose-1-phosphate guanylyltransferase